MASTLPLGVLPSSTSLSVSVPNDIIVAFKAFKQKRSATWIAYAIDAASFTLKETDRGIPGPNVVKDLVRALPPADGRYFVFDLAVKNSYGGAGSRLLFVTWAPSAAGRANVIYAAQRRTLDVVFTGCIDAHAATRDEVERQCSHETDKAGAGDDDWDPDA